MVSTLVRGVLIAWLAAAAPACGRALPTPETAPQPDPPAKWAEVPYPPPPARVEVVPPRPNDAALWVDGEWRWEGRRWIWHGGGWVAPAPGERLAPWKLVRQPDGALRWAPSAWVDAAGKPAPEPPIVVPAGRGGEGRTAPGG